MVSLLHVYLAQGFDTIRNNVEVFFKIIDAKGSLLTSTEKVSPVSQCAQVNT